MLLCKVASKTKIQMLQFDGVFFRETDEADLGIIIRNNEKNEKLLP